MDASVSLPDPGEFDRGLHNGHAAGLVLDQLHPFDPVDVSVPGEDIPTAEGVDDPLDDPTLPGDGSVLPFDPAEVGEVLAAPGLELGPNLIEAQTRALEAEFRAELDRFDHDDLHVEEADPRDERDNTRTHEDTDAGDTGGGTCCNLAYEQGYGDTELLPGFDTLTYADLQTCPPWCGDADLPRHGDGFDTTPESEVPHRGVPQEVPVRHGGETPDHTGRATVALQLEQDRDLTTGPVITLSVIVRGIEHTAWLTTTEATALHHTLHQMLDDTTRHR